MKYMELSEAIKTIKTEKEMNLYGNGYFICDIKAIDTVLKALDNSISKDEVRKKIKELKCIEPRDDEYNFEFQNEIEFKLDILKELLDK